MNEQDNVPRTGRQDFDRDLGRLEAELILMSGLVEQAIFNSLNALKNRDLERSQTVIDEDDRIDETELEIIADTTFMGRLGELGQPLIRRKARNTMEEFSKNLSKLLASGSG